MTDRLLTFKLLNIQTTRKSNKLCNIIVVCYDNMIYHVAQTRQEMDYIETKDMTYLHNDRDVKYSTARLYILKVV
jgi:hypothetical protein